MRPISSRVDCGDTGFADSVLLREILFHDAISNTLAYLNNIAFGKFGSMIIGSFLKKGTGVKIADNSALRGAVSHVFGICPSPKVPRIDAARIITRMADMIPVRNRAYPMFVGQTVCADNLVIVGPHAPIALLVGAGSPVPAPVLYNNIFGFKTSKFTFIHKGLSIMYTGYTLALGKLGGKHGW